MTPPRYPIMFCRLCLLTFTSLVASPLISAEGGEDSSLDLVVMLGGQYERRDTFGAGMVQGVSHVRKQEAVR